MKKKTKPEVGEYDWVIAKLRKWGTPKEYVDAVIEMNEKLKTTEQWAMQMHDRLAESSAQITRMFARIK